MKTNRELYEIAEKLGMIEEDDNTCEDFNDTRTDAEIFEEETSKDLINVMNFVENLTLYNDTETIKKFLVVLIYEGK